LLYARTSTRGRLSTASCVSPPPPAPTSSSVSGSTPGRVALAITFVGNSSL
jgi:hypothetical protein